MALVIAFRILRGDIALYGMLSQGGQRFDPERVQSLAVFIFVIGAFLVEAVAAPKKGSLPSIPESLLVLLGGSNGVYLAGKFARGEVEKVRVENKANSVTPSSSAGDGSPSGGKP